MNPFILAFPPFRLSAFACKVWRQATMTANLRSRLSIFLRLNTTVVEVTDEGDGSSCRHLVVRVGTLHEFIANVMGSRDSEKLDKLSSGCLGPYACGPDYYLLAAIPEGLRVAGIDFDGPHVNALLQETRGQHKQHLALLPGDTPDAPAQGLALAREAGVQTPFALALVDVRQKYAQASTDTLMCIVAKRDLEIRALRADKKRIYQHGRRHDAREAKRRPNCP